MDRLDVLQATLSAVQLLFVLALGACIGSLVNVLVYRLPRGLSVVTPPSRCPACQTRLTWRENIPVLGWIILRGRCRFCRAPISPEYPLVEALVSVLFAGLFALWYLVPPGATLLGLPIGDAAPEWARSGLGATWPLFALVLTLTACLVATTLIDARTFTIPLVLTWVPAAAALVVHPAWAAYVQLTQGRLWSRAPGWTWAIASPGSAGWWWIGASLGGAAGLVVANVLLERGLIRRSFADYDEWERQARAEMAQPPAQPSPHVSEPREESQAGAESQRGADAGPFRAPSAGVQREGVSGGAPIASGEPSVASQEPRDVPLIGSAPPPDHAADPARLWIRYPHARREMLKELVFLAPCLALAFAGGALARHLAGPWPFNFETGRFEPAIAAPLWLDVLAGVLMGYLIGGGVVWGVRIVGSLAFGKEAMGLGDVHLMGAVGACLGWVDAVMAFFGAAFVALAWALLSRVASGRLRRAMPYGPFLAVATLLVVLFKPGIERVLSALFSGLGPVNLP
jgi:prepilin signal peptidase PulO-like enzyme (type II secretory pathway)